MDTQLSSYPLDSATPWLDVLPAYDLNAEVDRMLDVSRMIGDSGGYYTQIVPFPNAQDTIIGAGQQLSGVIQVPKGSILVSVTGGSFGATAVNQFFLRVYDKATGNDLYNGQWGFGTNVAPSLVESVAGYPFGVCYLGDPYTIIQPNSLQLTVLNSATESQLIQVALCFAVPYSQPSGTRVDALIEE